MEQWMLHAFAAGPRVIERLTRVFPPERLDERIEKDRFTAREVFAHVADYEQTVLDRIRLANQKPGSQVPVFDPDQHATEHKYGEKDPFREAEVFESRRGMTIDYLRELTVTDLDKTFVRADGKAVTIRDYVGMVMAHDLEHIEQISAYLATEVATIY